MIYDSEIEKVWGTHKKELPGGFLVYACMIRDMNHHLDLFITSCPFWDALGKHIASSKCVVIDHPKDKIVKNYRSLSYNSITMHFDQDKKSLCDRLFGLEFSVEYVDESDQDAEYPPTTMHKFRLMVPAKLIIDFTMPKFNKWIDSMGVVRAEKRKKIALEQLKAIKAEFPELLLDKEIYVTV